MKPGENVEHVLRNQRTDGGRQGIAVQFGCEFCQFRCH